ncbi:glyoxylate/hydroxypyruvate reductase A [Pontibacter aydingkolensis]|uniref:Glyoxylate/hydroxypyruvate reductase A n=1 Tax=Pontibacter aydingkolensis TaxID=1911536 RepID=A0ABS7CZ89_9BACT|nr:glyoxylate/hydroxypyruvate reductase A [Pontibacter aydingkolensis]MBW7469147.1 glyoxylate/hydroxypyruvate reductase A [Pontibacter aydingkolensis]
MSILLVSRGRDVSPWIDAIQSERPDLEVRVYPDTAPKEDITFAISWNHPLGVFKEFPNLKCIASMGAGVDHILKDPELPENVVITRVTDEHLTNDMATFTTAVVLNYMRGLSAYKAAENESHWQPKPYLRQRDFTVGVMGMGVLGAEAAMQLKKLGFSVQGWAKSHKNIEAIPVYAGADELDYFLATSHVLICLLPLTPETANILNKTTFEKLPEGAYVINVARGEHLVEEDLLEMLDKGQLAGASLDVFRTEPLPKEHPFWEHPKIDVTPHIASVTNPASAAKQILQNYDRLTMGEPLINIVSRTKGY